MDWGAAAWLVVAAVHVVFWLLFVLKFARREDWDMPMIKGMEHRTRKLGEALALGVPLITWAGVSLAAHGWAAVIIAVLLHTVAGLALYIEGLHHQVTIVAMLLSAPLFVLVVPSLALVRLEVASLGTSISFITLLSAACALTRFHWSSLRTNVAMGTDTEAVEKEEGAGASGLASQAAQSNKAGVEAWRNVAAATKSAGSQSKSLPMSTLPPGSLKSLISLNIEVGTYFSIPFSPSMPTVALDFESVPDWARWWKSLCFSLTFLIGDFDFIDFSFIDFDIMSFLRPYHLQFGLYVLLATVVLPMYMAHLARRKTSVEQAAFVQIGFDAAAMLLTKQLASGLICTDYSQRVYVVMRNVSLAVANDTSSGVSDNTTAAGLVVRMSEQGFVATGATSHASTNIHVPSESTVWYLLALIAAVGFVLITLFDDEGEYTPIAAKKAEEEKHPVTGYNTWSRGKIGKACRNFGFAISASAVGVICTYAVVVYDTQTWVAWVDGERFGRVVESPRPGTNATEHAVQIEGSWLDAAGLIPGQAIRCHTPEHALISIIAMFALCVYMAQVFHYAVKYGKKSSGAHQPADLCARAIV